ncbi:hypothetical protein [Streptomyces sp. NPDC002078]
MPLIAILVLGLIIWLWKSVISPHWEVWAILAAVAVVGYLVYDLWLREVFADWEAEAKLKEEKRRALERQAKQEAQDHAAFQELIDRTRKNINDIRNHDKDEGTGMG